MIRRSIRNLIEALKNAEKSGAVSDQGTQKKESNEVTPSDETVPVEKDRDNAFR
ncbi:MAG: hypothetical protein K6E91_07205 [Butyrivibrio sp.]|nr:hypothetical protein [Butyrivibrio sp.]